MLFEPEKMIRYLNKKLQFCTEKVFEKLSLSVLPLNNVDTIWSRTPDKCIVYEICNKTSMSNWNEDKVEGEINTYKKITERTFDEVDDIFFDLVIEDVREMQDTADEDCLVAFIKRNDDMKKLYHISLLNEDNKRKKVVKTYIDNYKRKFSL